MFRVRDPGLRFADRLYRYDGSAYGSDSGRADGSNSPGGSVGGESGTSNVTTPGEQFADALASGAKVDFSVPSGGPSNVLALGAPPPISADLPPRPEVKGSFLEAGKQLLNGNVDLAIENAAIAGAKALVPGGAIVDMFASMMRALGAEEIPAEQAAKGYQLAGGTDDPLALPAELPTTPSWAAPIGTPAGWADPLPSLPSWAAVPLTEGAGAPAGSVAALGPANGTPEGIPGAQGTPEGGSDLLPLLGIAAAVAIALTL